VAGFGIGKSELVSLEKNEEQKESVAGGEPALAQTELPASLEA